VLLCHRSPHRQSYPNVWDFPGGHVEAGETPLQALRREVAEELQVAIQTDHLPEEPDLRVLDADLNLAVWVVRTWTGQPVNAAAEEHDRIDWFDIDRATTLNLAHPAYAEWLASLRGSD
jgi:mutator protein MutT